MTEQTQVDLAAFLEGMPRESVFVISDSPAFARMIQDTGRRVVLVNDKLAPASGLTVVKDWSDLERQWQFIGAPEARFIGLRKEQNECEELTGLTQLNYIVTHRRARHWVQYAIKNLKRLTEPSLMRLAGKYVDVPCFIVGAGPSLDKNMHLLAEAKQRGIVIAVNAAGKLLPEAPHITMSIESEDTRPLIGDTRDSIRAFATCCNPEVFEHGTGPLSPVFTSNPSGAVEELTGLQRLECCISVTTAALDLARRMSCSPIILVGQDLGLTGQKLYAQGAGGGSVDAEGNLAWGQAQRDLKRTQSGLPDTTELIEWPAWGSTPDNPQTTYITRDYNMILTYLANGAPKWTRGGFEMWDCTEGGSQKPGFTELTLAEALNRLAERPAVVPTTADLSEAMRQAGPLSEPTRLEKFIELQLVMAEATRQRASSLRAMMTALLQEPAGQPPAPLREMIGWCLNLSEWADAYAANAVYDAIEPFQRSQPVQDEVTERRATCETLLSAAAEIETSMLELEGLLRSAKPVD